MSTAYLLQAALARAGMALLDAGPAAQGVHLGPQPQEGGTKQCHPCAAVCAAEASCAADVASGACTAALATCLHAMPVLKVGHQTGCEVAVQLTNAARNIYMKLYIFLTVDSAVMEYNWDVASDAFHALTCADVFQHHAAFEVNELLLGQNTLHLWDALAIGALSHVPLITYLFFFKAESHLASADS